MTRQEIKQQKYEYLRYFVENKDSLVNEYLKKMQGGEHGYIYLYVGDDETPLYAGKTRNIRQRHYQHRVDPYVRDTRLKYIEVPIEEIDDAESTLIYLLKPLYNEVSRNTRPKNWRTFKKYSEIFRNEEGVVDSKYIINNVLTSELMQS